MSYLNIQRPSAVGRSFRCRSPSENINHIISSQTAMSSLFKLSRNFCFGIYFKETRLPRLQNTMIERLVKCMFTYALLLIEKFERK